MKRQHGPYFTCPKCSAHLKVITPLLSRATHRYNWKATDWKRTNVQLAEELQCHYETVARARKRYAPGTGRKNFDWTGVDWSKTNSEIAKLVGTLYPSVVSSARRKHAPQTLRPIQPTKLGGGK